MNTRLKQFLAVENITQSQLADSINIVRATVSHILSGRNNPSYDFIKALMERYPRLNMEWLIFGKGKMYKEPISATPDLFSTIGPEQEQIPAEIPVRHETVRENIPSVNDMIALDKVEETGDNQRKVSKIIILFNDGTFQEM